MKQRPAEAFYASVVCGGISSQPRTIRARWHARG
jgi:hypothetical protein